MVMRDHIVRNVVRLLAIRGPKHKQVVQKDYFRRFLATKDPVRISQRDLAQHTEREPRDKIQNKPDQGEQVVQ